MSWKSGLVWQLHRLKEKTGIYSYTRRQTYNITYRVCFLGNLGKLTAAIPLPPSTSAQTISNLQIGCLDAQIFTDGTFGNQFLIAQFSSSTLKELPVFRCTAEVHPCFKYSLEQTSNAAAVSATTTHLHPNDGRIQARAAKIKKGSHRRETAKNIYNHLVQTLTYGDPIDGLYSDLEALERSRVDCGGFGTLLISLCLAHDIPARLVSGFLLDGDKNAMHAWAEFQDENGDWIPVDPSTEQLARQGRTQKSGRFAYIGSDRLRLSQGCDVPIEWNNKVYKVPILQHPFVLEGDPGTSVRGVIDCVRL